MIESGDDHVSVTQQGAPRGDEQSSGSEWNLGCVPPP